MGRCRRPSTFCNKSGSAKMAIRVLTTLTEVVRHYLNGDRMAICEAEHFGDGNLIPAVCRIDSGRAKPYPSIVRTHSGIGFPSL